MPTSVRLTVSVTTSTAGCKDNDSPGNVPQGDAPDPVPGLREMLGKYTPGRRVGKYTRGRRLSNLVMSSTPMQPESGTF